MYTLSFSSQVSFEGLSDEAVRRGFGIEPKKLSVEPGSTKVFVITRLGRVNPFVSPRVHPLHDIAITFLEWCMAYTNGVDPISIYMCICIYIYTYIHIYTCAKCCMLSGLTRRQQG